MQQVGGALGLATLATLAFRHANDRIHHGVLPQVAITDGYVLAFRIGAISCLVGGVLILALLEHVVADPRNPMAEEAAPATT